MYSGIENNNYKHGDCVPSGNNRVSRLYITWYGMKSRCSNKNQDSYKDYGDKGIKVCPEWHDYVNFKEWALANGYADNLNIDRVDNSKDYNPENCQWITRGENSTKRNNLQRRLNNVEVQQIRMLYASGKGFTYKELARYYGLAESPIRDIIVRKSYENPI